MKVSTSYNTPAVKEALANNLYYMALFAKPEEFGEHLWVMLKRRGIMDAKDRTWVCDGAKWEWKQKEYHDPEGREILDFIHASERLVEVVNELYGEGTEKTKKCIGCMKTLLRKTGGASVLEGLRSLRVNRGKEKLSETIEYKQNGLSCV